MAFTVELREGSLAAIPLFYSATGWAMLEKGLEPNDPERRELWGGYLEDQLVRQEDGKRVIPLKLQGEFTSTDALIDAVNALEERLRHAARFRKDGWGDEVFLRFQLHSATYAIDYPVCSGSILKSDLMNACASIMTGGHRVTKTLVEVPITIVCEPYWESTATYTLENYIDNPGFWRGAAPGDSWTEVNGVDVTSTIDTTIYEVMGQSLKQVYVVDAVNDTGVISDAQTVVASTSYYFEVRNYRAAACDVLTAQVYDISNAAVIAASVLTFNGATAAWIKQGVAFNTPVGCISVRVELLCLAASSAAGGAAYWDAVYLQPRTDAPTGWSSGRNLMNHMDADADHLNVLCVTEIPGEVEAETSYNLDMDDISQYVRLAKRTRDNPYNFVWELNAANAVVTAGDATCIDSALVADAAAPGGQRVTVTFATNQATALRCYWDITANLASYYGKFGIVLIAKRSALTDTIKVQLYERDELSNYGLLASIEPAGTAWNLYKTFDGWEALSFRVGSSDNDLFGAGNNWRLCVYASITGGAAWDELHIAAVFLVPLDEGYLLAGGSVYPFGFGTMPIKLKNMDGDLGFFRHLTTDDSYSANIGMIGGFPQLTPKVENWLYLLTCSTSNQGYVLDDTGRLSVQYRPRGIFLRGSNP